MKPLDKLSPAASGALLVLIVSAVFSNVFQNSFHLDDFHTLLYNDHVHSLKDFPAFFTSGKGFSGTPFISGFRPLTVFINALNYRVSQTSPVGYHLVNLLLHLACSFLVWRIAFQLSQIKAVGLLSGFIFSLHPMNTEVVNYISSRSSSLSALFYLASFSAFIQYRRHPRIKWLTLSLLAFFLALLSKEVAITLPLLLISYDFLYQRHLKKREKVGIYFAYGFLVVLFLAVRHYFMTGGGAGGFSSPVSANHLIDAKNIFLGSVYLATQYLRLTFFPYPLTADHPFPKMELGPLLIFCLLFWVLAGLLLFVFRRHKTLLFLTSWFVITLLPVFLLPGMTSLSIFQENRGYLSGGGIVILVAWVLVNLKNQLIKTHPSLNYGFAVFLWLGISLFSYESYLRNQVWKSEVTLWGDAFKKNPASFIACFSLGYGYLGENNLDQALYFFKQSLNLFPPKDYLYYIHNNLGTVYYRQENNQKAFKEYLIAKELSPILPEAHINLALLYLKQGSYKKAAEELDTEMDVNYKHMEQRVLAAVEIERQGGKEAAGPLFLKIFSRLPDLPEYEGLRSLSKNHLKRLSFPMKRSSFSPFPLKKAFKRFNFV
ncbi:MAG: tetratricopeptide repeat protein [Nitrospirae bacterium]|nr:tetratricopeptide repeat protein [Nitrospirota bacterium]MBI3353085.1 tetratricopeptide repeat protein [Nitrospirota bacterium]